MKIAICYSGTLRNLPETIENNLAAFSYADIDLYFSTWDEIGYVDKMASPDYVKAERLLPADTKITDSLIRSLIPDIANIKAIKIDTFNPKHYPFNLVGGVDNPGLGSQYYKIEDCFSLLDPAVKYDAVVRLRCDMLLNNKMSETELREVADAGKLIHTKSIWYNHFYQAGLSHSINEMIWIGGMDVMKKACSIHSNMEKISHLIGARDKFMVAFGEAITYLNLEVEGLVNKVEIFDFNYQVLR